MEAHHAFTTETAVPCITIIRKVLECWTELLYGDVEIREGGREDVEEVSSSSRKKEKDFVETMIIGIPFFSRLWEIGIAPTDCCQQTGLWLIRIRTNDRKVNSVSSTVNKLRFLFAKIFRYSGGGLCRGLGVCWGRTRGPRKSSGLFAQRRCFCYRETTSASGVPPVDTERCNHRYYS